MGHEKKRKLHKKETKMKKQRKFVQKVKERGKKKSFNISHKDKVQKYAHQIPNKSFYLHFCTQSHLITVSLPLRSS